MDGIRPLRSRLRRRKNSASPARSAGLTFLAAQMRGNELINAGGHRWLVEQRRCRLRIGPEQAGRQEQEQRGQGSPR